MSSPAEFLFLFYPLLPLSYSISIQNVIDFYSPSFLFSLLCPHQTSSLFTDFPSSMFTNFTPSFFHSYLFSLSPHFLFLSYHPIEITRYLKLICTLLGASRARSHPPLLQPLLSSRVSKYFKPMYNRRHKRPLIYLDQISSDQLSCLTIPHHMWSPNLNFDSNLPDSHLF